MSCGECRFYQKKGLAYTTGSFSFGSCLRFPPVPISDGTAFPEVYEDTWCGEFSQRDPEKTV